MDKNYSECLTDILKTISEQKRNGLQYDAGFQDDMSHYNFLKNRIVNDDITTDDFDLMFSYLVSEGMIVNNASIGKFRITFKGADFHRQGGYTRHYRDIAHDKRIARRNDKLLRNYTFWLALGSCIAGIYFLIEIYKFFYSLCHA